VTACAYRNPCAGITSNCINELYSCRCCRENDQNPIFEIFAPIAGPPSLGL
jgi:hypothetical protein